jgi:outer membrane protein TolC
MAATRLNSAGVLVLPDELPADLLLRRPDIQAALARVQAADAGAEAARLARYPTISISAFAGTAGLSVGDLLSAPARNFGFGPKLLLPIFDAGLLRARYRGASAELDGAIAAYHGVVLHAVHEAGDQLSLVRAYAAEHADAQQQFDYSKTGWRLAEHRFQAGLTPEQQVLEAQSRVLAARANLLSTQSLEAEARVALLVALGGSTKAPEAPKPSNRKSPP